MEEWVEIFNPNSTIVKFYGNDKIIYIYNNYIIGYDLINKRRFYSLNLDEFEELKDKTFEDIFITKTKAIIQTSHSKKYMEENFGEFDYRDIKNQYDIYSEFLINLELKNITKLKFKFLDLSFEKDYILLSENHIIIPEGEIKTIERGNKIDSDNFLENNPEDYIFFKDYIYIKENNTIHKYDNLKFSNGEILIFKGDINIKSVNINEKNYYLSNYYNTYNKGIIYLKDKNLLYIYYNTYLFIYNLNEEKLLYHFEFEYDIIISNNGKYLLLRNIENDLITVYALEKKIKLINRIAKLSIDKYLHQGKLRIIDKNEVEDKYNESFIREMFSTIKDSIDETDFDYSKDYIELKDHTLVQMEKLIDEIITESDITNKRLYDYLGTNK